MKKWILALSLLPMAATAQQRFTIEGKIADWKGTDSLMLIRHLGADFTQERVVAKDGHFTYTGEFTTHGTIAFRLDHPGRPDRKNVSRDNISLWLEPGTITITGRDSLKTAAIKGGQLNTDAVALKKATDPISAKLSSLRMNAMKATEEERASPAFKKVDEEYAKLVGELIAANADFIRKHPNSPVALAALKQLAGPRIDYEKIAPLYEGMSAKMKASADGTELGERLRVAAQTTTGVVMPNFVSYDTLRAPLELKTVLAGSKLTLVDFWASWCGPCRAENPNVVKAFEAFNAKGFNIISVSLDDNAGRWKAAIIKDGMPWYHVSSLQKWDEPIAKQFGVNAVPDNFLLDEKGKVVGRGLKGEALYKAIEARLR
ncbi:TlpA disulfide reductase family protein [Chitinophaga pollutisoli]|uniref:TlpA disulfide reductase family protein n=1 Tax=Chitinophaga pollutisoli TaxID=3133966 RepID=A0ABZ2YUB7_9BACT